MELQTLENNLKEFISDPDSTNHLVKAKNIATQILKKNKKSDYANYVLALDDIEFCNYEEAKKKLHTILSINKKFVEAYLQLSFIYDYEKNYEEKFKILAKGYENCSENYMIAYEYACRLLHDYGELEKAKEIFSDCVHKLPQIANNWSQLGAAYIATLEPEMAKECFFTALHLDGENLMAILGLGVYFSEKLNFKKSKEFYNKTLELDPKNKSVKFNLAILELLSGDYDTGLKLYEKNRDKQKFLKKYGGEGYPELTKRSLKEKNLKIIVMREQGYGDDFMASRYLKSLIEKNYKISFAAHDNTIKFFKSCPELDQIKISNDFKDVDQHSYDYRVFLMSLHYYFWDKIKIPKPLVVDYNRLEKFNKKFITNIDQFLNNNRSKVAVAWSGNPLHKRHMNRSMPLETFSKIFLNKDHDFFVLQKNISTEEKKLLEKFSNVTILDNLISDFSESALVISRMDKVISVDTSLIHLAGTLGKKSLLFLPKVPDWRWGLSGEKSQWYNSIKIVRQTDAYQWKNLIKKSDLFLNKS